MITRRDALVIGIGAPIALFSGRAWAASGEFWNTKQPSEWSSDEIARLLNNSPWAKEFPLQVNNGGGLGRQGGGYGGRRSMGGGGMGYPSAGGPMGTGGPNVQFKVLVRWESAKPILAAKKTEPPKGSADHYIISLTGMPIAGPDRSESGEAHDDAAERVKDQTTIERKGKEAVTPDSVDSSDGPGAAAILLAFPRDYQPIEASEKELTLITKIGKSMELKAKFNIRDMMYRGELAL